MRHLLYIYTFKQANITVLIKSGFHQCTEDPPVVDKTTLDFEGLLGENSVGVYSLLCER